MFGSGPGKWNDHVYGAGVVRTILREHRKFDLVYFLMAGVQVAYGVPAARAVGLPSVMKFSGSNDLRDALRCMIGPLEVRAISRWCERTMILNDAMVEEALQAGFDRSRLLWMPNPVDTDRYCPCNPEEKLQLRVRLGLPAGVPVAVFVGRLAPEKELPSLLSGFAIAAARHESARLVIVGDGVLRQQLEGQAETLGIASRVTFAGMQNPDEIRYWLQASDVFTLVSHREGLPVSLIEAMSVGLPSVVTNLPANAQLVSDGEHGFHVGVQDPEAIAAAFLRLFGDPGLRQKLGAAARPVAVERFSIDTVLNAYEDMFGEILSKRRGG
jgi:glycosyltransferase involved in cell wall biosynthesis